MGDLIFRRDRDRKSRDKTERRTHTDGEQEPYRDRSDCERKGREGGEGERKGGNSKDMLPLPKWAHKWRQGPRAFETETTFPIAVPNAFQG